VNPVCRPDGFFLAFLRRFGEKARPAARIEPFMFF
jgi:hypothetical protein